MKSERHHRFGLEKQRTLRLSLAIQRGITQTERLPRVAPSFTLLPFQPMCDRLSLEAFAVEDSSVSLPKGAVVSAVVRRVNELDQDQSIPRSECAVSVRRRIDEERFR